MGVGRRMKKQGMPEALSEEHFANLKRKKGLPVDDAPAADAPTSKKRRTSKKGEQSPKTPAKGKINAKNAGSTPAAKKPNGAKVASPASTKTAKKSGKSKSKAALDSDDDPLDDEDDEVESLGDLDLEDDELGGAKLRDDFLDDDDDSVFDSDEEAEKKQKFVFSEDEDDDSDREERLTAANIEGLSRVLDKQLEDEAAENEEEMREDALQTNIADDKPHVLESDDDEVMPKAKALLAPDLQMLRTRITDTVRVLEDFANLSEEGRSRAEYSNQLLKDICAYYGYSEYLAQKLMDLFPAREAFAFFEANETPRPVVIRTNTLRTSRRDLAQALVNRGVTLEPVGKWSKVGLQIFDSNVPLGATPEYLGGHYILQAASSFLPVMALCPQENERVLDMSAAPGGKTTHCAALMKNTGVIIANDPNKARSKGLIGNIHRLGVKNSIVCNYDAREIPNLIGGFDRVLLDAPCSGTGVISKDPSVKTNKTEKDFMQLPHVQKQLLLAAIDATKVGGYIVYSTCSVTVEENEQVVNYALSRRSNVELLETGLPFGKEGFTSFMGKKFHPSVKMTRRYYPHTYNVDGFYVAKFKKTGPTPANARGGASSGEFAANSNGSKTTASGEDEMEVDKTPVEETEEGANDEFGGFDDDGDKDYMERAKRNAMRRRGLDPKALDRPKKAKKA
ncbi:rRNA (cytosine-C5-)-methyltransferase nop2 [Pyricularia oryzae]|uniref:rRNA (Cytosine-C5-)-methyltransferase nop2 n=2 Tax=Pyricularia TaxID=48558 RepID=A0ABQ8N5B1_PYRGI|nr:rRNA (cytosine-C5-)-methyltransferase nop2 [Pyricularia oryzae]KAI6291471.1 rRNA (cytosine-C5-)-methyltransferase nop2 [Pyricularia grisea]KAI6262100.1 rRNA (cytosine-C5-)-methyltransferase nop2 [Pyricularia oryzae]KAI6264350.1 rRNA (cytosine-C5-)-methyltransferase nop2 [Pyricularia oryzae]KAI6268077.1 rRNA (cytosine-C5-)-methyltransferase nop2 [Pyricularia oryzae]